MAHGLGIAGVNVSMHEPLTASRGVRDPIRARHPADRGLASPSRPPLHRFAGHWIIAIDEDIDPENATRCSGRCPIAASRSTTSKSQHKDRGHGPRGPRDDGENASVLINATLKGPSAPVALPKREFMERAKTWERLGLPPLEPEMPWYGYPLGAWPAELERQARMAAKSEYFELGKNLANERRSDVAMNTPVQRD